MAKIWNHKTETKYKTEWQTEWETKCGFRLAALLFANRYRWFRVRSSSGQHSEGTVRPKGKQLCVCEQLESIFSSLSCSLFSKGTIKKGSNLFSLSASTDCLNFGVGANVRVGSIGKFRWNLYTDLHSIQMHEFVWISPSMADEPPLEQTIKRTMCKIIFIAEWYWDRLSAHEIRPLLRSVEEPSSCAVHTHRCITRNYSLEL